MCYIDLILKSEEKAPCRPKKEEWEVRFEEYRDTLVSLGAKNKNEKALKLAFKIYGEERMPARIYQNCVEETGAVSSKTESPTPTETVKKKKKAETDTSTKPSTPPNGKKPTSLNSFEALADIRLEETAAGHVETTSPTEERKEKKNAQDPARTLRRIQKPPSGKRHYH